jgi:hypothetical protein
MKHANMHEVLTTIPLYPSKGRSIWMTIPLYLSKITIANAGKRSKVAFLAVVSFKI